jgi:16S rRNA (cytosine1402-N4)-methyltransferase
MYHKAVLLKESIDALNIGENRDGIYIDATLGGGGHSKEILNRLSKNGRLVVFDQDEDAIANAPADERVTTIRSNFRFLENHIIHLGVGKISGVIADLGVSSHQFDTADRGFSYRFDSELDMRMNKLSQLTAADVVNSYSLSELTRVFREYGELPNGAVIAKLLCNAREIKSTAELAEVLKRLYTPVSAKKFLSKVFQALRIEVNGEMKALEDLLIGSKMVLKSGGRLSIITYHSLEDRIVKNFLRECKEEGSFNLVSKKPIEPTLEEIKQNPRSRSAKLRIAERV